MSKIDYMYDYYPESISEVTDEQRRIRERVQGFMSGEPDPELFYEIVNRVKSIVNANQVDIICFAPGTTGAKTILRYGELAEVLDREVDCDVFLDAITLKFDADPITHERYYKCKQERVKDKNVLVLGSVYTTGKSYNSIMTLLNDNGAKETIVIYVARTISK